MNKAKLNQPSGFWARWGQRLRGSRPFDLHTNLSIGQIKQALDSYQSSKPCLVTTETTPAGMHFWLTMFQHGWFRWYPVAWMEAEAKAVENMDVIHIQGKVYTRNQYALVVRRTFVWFGLSLGAFFTLGAWLAALIACLIPILIYTPLLRKWAEIPATDYPLLEEFEFTIKSIGQDSRKMGDIITAFTKSRVRMTSHQIS